MPAFEFVALDGAGKRKTGVIEGDNPRQVRQTLRERGLSPTDVKPIAGDRARSARTEGGLGRGMSSSELAVVTRQLATLVRSGTPVEEALATVSRQTEKARVTRIISAVRARVVEGHTLEGALDEFPNAFPDLYRSTVAAGEQSGHLDSVLDRLADYTESRQQLQSRITTALVYPIILTSVALLVVIGLLTYVVPQVVQVFSSLGRALPLPTQILIAISENLKRFGPAMLILLVAGVFMFRRLLRNDALRTQVHHFILRLPLIARLVKGFNTARFARTLSILVASGVPVLEALKISADVMPNLPMRKAVINAADAVREGSSLNASLDQSKLFPPITLHLIASGEASGNLETMLERAASHQERELETTISVLLALFEPLLILVMGAIVLFIVLSILLPIFELNKVVQ